MFVAFKEVCTPENLIFLLQGALISFGIAAIALCIGICFGIMGAAAKISKNPILRFIGNIYVEIIRGTPMLLQITILYTALPLIYTVVTGNIFRPNLYIVGIVAMSINSGAYTTELIRSGIMGIDKGQWEASEAIGLSYRQTLKLVILPQAFKRIVPPLVSEFVTLIKDSSLISVIGAVELMKSAQILGGRYYDMMSPLLIVASFYLIMTLSISFVAKKIERKLASHD